MTHSLLLREETVRRLERIRHTPGWDPQMTKRRDLGPDLCQVPVDKEVYYKVIGEMEDGETQDDTLNRLLDEWLRKMIR